PWPLNTPDEALTSEQAAHRDAIAAAARALNAQREAWLNPSGPRAPRAGRAAVAAGARAASRRGGGEGAGEAHTDEPLQPAPDVAREPPRRPRRCRAGSVRVASRVGGRGAATAAAGAQ